MMGTPITVSTKEISISFMIFEIGYWRNNMFYFG
jgi:hypothetical protein